MIVVRLLPSGKSIITLGNKFFSDPSLVTVEVKLNNAIIGNIDVKV